MIFKVAEHIDAPVAHVWRYLTEPGLMNEWMTGIESVRTEHGRALESGMRLYFSARGTERSSAVVDFETERCIALQSKQGPFTATYRYGLRPDGEATVVELEADCVATGIARIIAPVVRSLIRRSDQNQLTALKGLAEQTR